MEANPVIRSR